jgi:hypothetical protein
VCQEDLKIDHRETGASGTERVERRFIILVGMICTSSPKMKKKEESVSGDERG